MKRWYRDGANGPLGLAVAALLCLGYALWLYKYPVLRGTSPFWWREDADITQYLAGFNAFVHEPWHWPLLRMTSLNAPEGTYATFLDTVPLYALFLKLVHPGAGYWNPYGLWIALCFTLQGVGAWWICREAKIRSWPVLVALALLLACFPAFTRRIPHTSLMSQWLLLFALALYLRSGRMRRLATWPWVALIVGAFYINIYLFVMVSSVFAADVLREALRRPDRRASLQRALLAPVLAYGLLYLSMWITLLPLPPGAAKGDWGFGYYSMNLLSPLNGGMLLRLEHPQAADTQGEGHNYLGIFLLALTVVVYRLRARSDPAFWRRHAALFAVLVLLTLYALSNRVFFGPTLLYTVWVPSALENLTATFRSSGRFFWPVGYAIVVFTVLGVARYIRPRPAAALLAALVALQLWDLKLHHESVRAEIAQGGTQVIDAGRWDAFLGPDVQALNYYPPSRCSQSPAHRTLLPTMVYAVKHGYPLSTGYIARTAKPCTGYDTDVARLPASTAVVFEKEAFPNQGDAERMMGPDATCADMQAVFLCRRNRISPPPEKP